jgi:hypothetical protein
MVPCVGSPVKTQSQNDRVRAGIAGSPVSG